MSNQTHMRIGYITEDVTITGVYSEDGKEISIDLPLGYEVICFDPGEEYQYQIQLSDFTEDGLPREILANISREFVGTAEEVGKENIKETDHPLKIYFDQ